MTRPRRHAPLNIFLNRRPVGSLTRQAGGAIVFRYDGTWLSWEHALPVSLSLPLREDPYTGAPVEAVFDNLLPDTAEIRRRVAENTGAAGTDAYSLLAAIGRDCIGALQFLPAGDEPDPQDALSGEVLSDADIGGLLAGLANAPLGLEPERDFRISLAGAQEKTALLRKDGVWLRPHGTTPTTHILKPRIGPLAFGIDLSDSVENEHLCLLLLKAFGLAAASTEIARFAGQQALVVERFDRRWTGDGRLVRVPQEDLCQALGVPPVRKYQNEGGPGIGPILDLLQGSDTPEEDRMRFLKAQILYWLMAATDGHAKNFSVYLMPGGRYRLAPLYDAISLQPAFDAGQVRRRELKMAMSVGTNRHYRLYEIMPRHFGQTALQAGLGADCVNRLLDEIADRFAPAWDAATAALPAGFPEGLVQSVRDGMDRRLGLDRGS